MKVAKFVGNRKIEIIKRDIPKVLLNDEVIVKVTSCALCGSDKRLFSNGADHIPGHEISGLVYETGKDTSVKTGTRVIIYIPKYCGECKLCKKGITNCCQNMDGLIGWQHDGGYAEYVRVPEKNIISLPDYLSYIDGILLLDTVGTAAHAVRLALHCPSVKAKFSKVLVIGCGPLGLGCILVLKAFGFDNIYASDLSEKQIALAESFGAKPYRNSDSDEIKTEFQLVIEASGSAGGRKLGLYAVEPKGAFVILGESNHPFIIEPTPALRRKDFYTIRSFYFPLNEVEDNFKLYRKHKDLFRKIVSEYIQLEHLESTFERFYKGETLKPFVNMEDNKELI